MRSVYSAASIHGLTLIGRASLETGEAPRPLNAVEMRLEADKAVCLNCTRSRCSGTRKCMLNRAAEHENRTEVHK
jgi:hypothetical protein